VFYLCDKLIEFYPPHRLSAAERQLKDIKSKIELSDCNWEISSTESVHIYANLFKMFLRELPDPVVPFNL